MSKTVPLTLEQNSSYTVLLVDKGNGLEPQVKRDSTGVGTVPTGGVNTGLGGAAGPDPLLLAGAAGAALLVAALAVGVAVRRHAVDAEGEDAAREIRGAGC